MARRIRKSAKFASVARSGHYDVIDAWLYPSDVITAFVRPLARNPVVISGRRNLDPHESFGRAGRFVDGLAIRMTDAVVANSAAAAAYAISHERLDPAKVRIIRNGVELIAPMASAARVASRLELGAAADELVVGCVANYLPVKGHDLLIDAFSRVADAAPGARLVLVGEGPMRAAMEGQIRTLGLDGRVRLFGSVADPTGMLGAFDVVVQASRSEGLPNALLEAAAAGRPIVATAAGGSGEIILDGQTGLLVPIDDGDALASALLRVLRDVDLRYSLGPAARERAATMFGMDRFVTEFAALYQELATARGLPG
jgi:glycosyltransferase involved in cell wall biosynthesis